MDRMQIAPTDRSMPGGQDDQGLADRQRGDHRGLLDDDRQRARLGEPRVDDGEDDDGDDQHHQRAEGGMGVQQVLDALHRRLAPHGELLSGSRRGVGIDAHSGLPCR